MVKIVVLGSVLEVTVTILECSPVFPFGSKAISILADLPGAIGSRGNEGTVQPHEPSALKIMSGSLPVFVNSMQVWQGVLAGIPADVVQAAVKRAFSAHPEFPPSLAQFAAICSAVMPRKTYAEEVGLPALPPPTPAAPSAYSFTHLNDGRDWARRILAGIEAGEKRTSTVVRFARQALGVEA